MCTSQRSSTVVSHSRRRSCTGGEGIRRLCITLSYIAENSAQSATLPAAGAVTSPEERMQRRAGCNGLTHHTGWLARDRMGYGLMGWPQRGFVLDIYEV
jgi:hypothetical protein